MGISVYEQFVSWQGEGPRAGLRAMVYRFAGCDVRCSWCDTKVVWVFGTGREEADVMRAVVEEVPLVVITGGEPLHPLNRPRVRDLVLALRDVGFQGSIEIETSGKYGREGVDSGVEEVTYIVSPKPWFVEKAEDKVFGVDRSWFGVDNVVFKVVVGKEYSVGFYQMMLSELLLRYNLDNKRIWLMPKGNTVSEVLKNVKLVVELAEEFHVNVTSRLQVLYKIK